MVYSRFVDCMTFDNVHAEWALAAASSSIHPLARECLLGATCMAITDPAEISRKSLVPDRQNRGL